MNKYQKALETIDDSRMNEDIRYDIYDVELMQELVNKATPTKPNYEAYGYSKDVLVYDTWLCPNCEARYEVDYDEYDYCPNCGQAIDWSGYEN